MRFVNLIIFISLACFGFVVVQPDTDTGIPMFLVLASQVGVATVALLFALVARKILLPYIKVEQLIQKAQEHPIGAGLVVFGVLHLMTSLVSLFGAQVR